MGGDPLVGEACLNWLLIRRRLAKKRPRVEGLVRFILHAVNFKHCRQIKTGNQDAPSGWVWATIEETPMEQDQNGLLNSNASTESHCVLRRLFVLVV